MSGVSGKAASPRSDPAPGLLQVCDEEWHHYVLNVEFPSVTLYVDGVSHEPFSVTEDYPLHPSKIETQLVVGACWQGNSHWHPFPPRSLEVSNASLLSVEAGPPHLTSPALGLLVLSEDMANAVL